MLARDLGSPIKSATATVTIVLEDANNKSPVFSTALYIMQMKEDDGKCILVCKSSPFFCMEFLFFPHFFYVCVGVGVGVLK